MLLQHNDEHPHGEREGLNKFYNDQFAEYSCLPSTTSNPCLFLLQNVLQIFKRFKSEKKEGWKSDDCCAHFADCSEGLLHFAVIVVLLHSITSSGQLQEFAVVQCQCWHWQ